MKYKKHDKFIIEGGNSVNGEITIQSSKNASLPLLSACLLANNDVVLNNLPDILDIHNMISIMRKLGVKVKKNGKNYTINSSTASGKQIDCKLSKTMRSSLFFLGSALSRFKSIMITLPGGCNIGKRPIDIHISALKKLNVKIKYLDDCIFFDAAKAKSNKIKLKIPSVGATENILQFACLLKGKTIIFNPAKEPEVVELANFLNKMGAKITGAGSGKITIYGVDALKGTTYTPMGDRIVAGTIMGAVAMCGGNVVIKNGVPHQNEKLIEILLKLGCKIKIKNDIIQMSSNGALLPINEISTDYYPGFPTDLQSILLSLCTIKAGKTKINENIFENRFLTVSELTKMGAIINFISDKEIEVEGVKNLHSAQVEAKDLRGGASLVLAGLVAKGQTIVKNVHFIDRGYEHFEDALTKLNLNIRRE